jgi:hypothetical protein
MHEAACEILWLFMGVDVDRQLATAGYYGTFTGTGATGTAGVDTATIAVSQSR